MSVGPGRLGSAIIGVKKHVFLTPKPKAAKRNRKPSGGIRFAIAPYEIKLLPRRWVVERTFLALSLSPSEQGLRSLYRL